MSQVKSSTWIIILIFGLVETHQKKDAFKRYHKKFPTASITDYYERHDFERLEWYIPVDDYYTTSVWGYVHLPSKTNYRRIIKMGKIKLN